MLRFPGGATLLVVLPNFCAMVNFLGSWVAYGAPHLLAAEVGPFSAPCLFRGKTLAVNVFFNSLATSVGLHLFSLEHPHGLQYGGSAGKRHRLREAMLWVDPPEYYSGKALGTNMLPKAPGGGGGGGGHVSGPLRSP